MTRKKIIILVGVVIVIELIGAYFYMNRNTPPAKTTKSPTVSLAKPSSTEPIVTIDLQSSKSSIKVGEKVEITAVITSPLPTDGTDLVVIYNPKLLKIVPDAKTKAPLKTGTLYDDYPSNIVDEKNGRISVSGISLNDKSTPTIGEFGTLTFKALASGPTVVVLEFVPDKTTDSNVIESKTARDILKGVKNVDLNILP